ncbi:MAG: hypothetical protein WCS65_11370 [Verrucomicrobiae bacterium]
MKTSRITLVVAIAISLNTLPAADDISAILNQIEGQGSAKKNTSIEKSPAPATAPTSTPAPKKKKISPVPKAKAIVEEPVAKVQPTPQITILKPTDKLPKNFRGMGLAGKFRICGTDGGGSPLIVAAEDYKNPFARQFWIINSDVGLGPNRSFQPEDRPPLDVPQSKPLIFVGVFVPGVYNVKMP